jgi:CRISPR/Cas system-associated protein Cas10 (large subunit of type III CRISPR-Cas system)
MSTISNKLEELMSRLWRNYFDSITEDTAKQEAFEKAFADGWESREELDGLYNKAHIKIVGKPAEDPSRECDCMLIAYDFDPLQAVG